MATSGSHSHGPPPLPEPRTPAWLTALGGLLFVGVAVCWASRPTEPGATETKATTGTATATATALPAGNASAPPPPAGAASALQRALHPRRPAH